MVIEAVILLFILSLVWNYYDKKLDISEQNLIASNSKINELVLKNGDLIYERDSYILKVNELEEKIGITKQEANEIKRKLDSSLAYISKIESTYKIDTVYTVKDSIVYVNNEHITAHFSYKDKWFGLNGTNDIYFGNDNNIKNVSTNIYNMQMKTDLTIGVTDDYKLFIKSNNPYLIIDNMNGAAIENSIMVPRKKRINFGIQVGFGCHYGLISKSMDIGPYGGVGVEYNF